MRYLLALLLTLIAITCYADTTLTDGVDSRMQCKAAEWPKSTFTFTVTTDINATVKYATSDIAYGSMITFGTTGGTTHTQDGGFGCGGSYSYYVKCVSGGTAFHIVFSIDKDPPPQRHYWID